MGELKIGVVTHQTGRLSQLGTVLRFAAELWRTTFEALRPIPGHRVDVLACDSMSEPAGAQAAAGDLVRRGGAGIVLTLGGTDVVPAVADACRRLGVPCVSTNLPWQVYRTASPATASAWCHHFCWGLDDIAEAFADAWSRVPGGRSVGCLWNSGPQGQALRTSTDGFATTAQMRGFALVDPPPYEEDQADFEAQVAQFLERDVQVVTSAATARDLGAFHRLAGRRGLRLALLTCSRWLSYPAGATSCGVDDVVAPVYWSPSHPYRSDISGMDCGELDASYERATGQRWLQPLGLAHALFEVGLHALRTAADPADPAAVAEALRRTRIATVAGPLDWTAGPTPGIARMPLVTGQWQRGAAGVELVIVDNARLPRVPVGGTLRLAG